MIIEGSSRPNREHRLSVFAGPAYRKGGAGAESCPPSLVEGATLEVYPGARHGITDTHKDELNADLLAFLES